MKKVDWKYLSIDEIQTDMYRGSGIKRDQITSDGFPCIRYGEIYTTYNYAFKNCVSHTDELLIHPCKYFEKGDILFAITGESVEDIGKCIAYLGEERCLLGGDIVAMKHKQNPKYIVYALSSPSAVKQKGLGKTKLKVVHTNIPSLKKIIIPLPPSIEAQQQIVEYLDNTFEKIDRIKEKAEKKIEDAKGLFQAALNEKLKMREGWKEMMLKEIASYFIGLTYKPNEVSDKGVIVLRSSNIQNGLLDLSDKVRVTSTIKDQLYVKQGDILMCSRNGSSTLVGKTCLIPKLNEKMTFGTFMTVIRSEFNTYLCYFFRSNSFRKQIKHGEANMINQITRYMLDDVKLAIPPLATQQQIVSDLDALNEKTNAIEHSCRQIISECDNLKQAILKQVFE